MFSLIKKIFEKEIYYEVTAEQVLRNTNNKYKMLYDQLGISEYIQTSYYWYNSKKYNNTFVVICNLYDKEKDIFDKKKYIVVTFADFKEILLNKCNYQFTIHVERNFLNFNKVYN